MTLFENSTCSCERNALTLIEGGQAKLLCPVCGELTISCRCPLHPKNECDCGFPALFSPGNPSYPAYRRCGNSPGLCRCPPKEVSEFRSDRTFQDWLWKGGPLAFAMQKIAERKWAERTPRSR